MKAKAEIGTRFIKLSDDMVEALSRVPLSACAFRVLLWFIAYTYGRRVKRDGEWCAIDAVDATHNYIAEDTGLHRSRISSVINRLLQFKIIRSKTDGSLGLNSNLQQWAIRFAGRDFKAIPSPTVLGQTVLGPKRTNNVRFCPPPLVRARRVFRVCRDGEGRYRGQTNPIYTFQRQTRYPTKPC